MRLLRVRLVLDPVLAAALVVWEPLTFALVASAALGRLIEYGPPAIALLAYRGFVVALGIAAGRALWQADEGGARLGRWWAALHALGLVLTFSTPYFPGNRVPSTKCLHLAAFVALDVAIWAWLWLSRRQ